MRFRTFAVALLVGGGLALGTAVESAAATHAGPSVDHPDHPDRPGPLGAATVSARSVSVGESVLFGGGGFAPGGTITIRVNNNTVGTATADDQGSFSLRPPAFTAPGDYVVTGTGPSAADPGLGLPEGLPTGLPDAVAESGGTALDGLPQRTVTATVTVTDPSAGSSAGGAPSAAGNGGDPRVGVAVGGWGSPDGGAGGVGVAFGVGGGGGGGDSGGDDTEEPAPGGGGVGVPVVLPPVPGGDGPAVVGQEPVRPAGQEYPSTGGLPFTGVETGAMAAIAAALVGGGVILRVAARRRRPGATPDEL
ncbi:MULTISPECIES: hypothetical protein [Protofrankia]|uniref:LPXTG-motif cell wall anchor domain protein n=1 Tax=Candidatus Protofrankia datiscae TaxID=2716812 RepID=F8AV81_9ACTN|nr:MULTISPECIES: hypothetical protein [Protofrankia]AEH10841.1 hypothetical protein FsymDg_3562 [Candidatus Protofrankia datiscae]